MKFIRVLKATSIDNRLQKIVNDSLTYEYMGDDGRMVNPTPLLKKYEDRYNEIRPKDIDFGYRNKKAYIKYVSQGCKDSKAMFNLVHSAISKDATLKNMYDEGNLIIQVCDRNNWGDWKTFTGNGKIRKKPETDLSLVDQVYKELKQEFGYAEFKKYKQVNKYKLVVELGTESEEDKTKGEQIADKFNIDFREYFTPNYGIYQLQFFVPIEEK